MPITIKPMETDEEIKGKAFVHWKCWQETYPGLVSQDYLNKFTLEKSASFVLRCVAVLALLYALLMPFVTGISFRVSFHRALMILLISRRALSPSRTG